jgi:spore coat polysaccharide biosynthesis predicted glycosyltransferase SpsG
MSDADLAIGAAGSTSWERCCLGLPTLQLVLAENQRSIAKSLSYAGAAKLLKRESLSTEIQGFINLVTQEPARLICMSNAAAAITDGLGAERVAQLFSKGMHA